MLQLRLKLMLFGASSADDSFKGEQSHLPGAFALIISLWIFFVVFSLLRCFWCNRVNEVRRSVLSTLLGDLLSCVAAAMMG